MAFNPCFCGCSLKKASWIIAILDMVMFGLFGFLTLVGGGISVGIMASASPSDNKGSVSGATIALMLLIFISLFAVFIGKFYVGLVLKRGADQDDLKKCEAWFIVSGILFVLFLIQTIPTLYYGSDRIETVVALVLLYLFVALYEGFCLWIVYLFMGELKNGQRFASNQDLVSSPEIEFRIE